MRPTSAHSGLRGPPLSLCDIIHRGYLSQVHLLVRLGASLEARDASGRTPLMLTAYVQPEDWGVGIARLLIEQGVRMSHRDRHGMNALHHACVYERVQLVRVLLNAPDFDLVQCDRFGNTALHYAAMSGSPALVRLLVSYHHRYRHPLTKLNRQGRTAKDQAEYAGYHLCVALLEESDTTYASPCPPPYTTGTPNAKDGGLSHRTSSECGSNTPSVFFTKEDSVTGAEASEGGDTAAFRAVAPSSSAAAVVVVSTTEDSSSPFSPKTFEEGAKKTTEVPEDEGKPPKLSLRREGEEERGLSCASNDQNQHQQQSSQEVGEAAITAAGGGGGGIGSSKHLLSPYHTPPTSDRSSEPKLPRSQNSSPRTRRSGIRRAHPAPAQPPSAPANASATAAAAAASGLTRRISAGSSSSTRSAATAAAKMSPGSVQGSSSNTTNASNNKHNNTATTATAETGTTGEDQTNMENEVNEVLAMQRAKSPSLQSLRANSVLRENTLILNNLRNAININSTNNSSEKLHAPKVLRPPLMSPGSNSLVGFRKDPTFLTRSAPTPSQYQPLPYEKDPERVIYAASEHDFRNTREYVLKLTRMKFSPAHFDTDSLPVLVRPSPSSLVPLEEDGARKPPGGSTGSWRDNIRFLYRHLEYHCSPSWRDAASVPADPLTLVPHWGVTSPSVDEGEETKEKKARRPSSSNKPAAVTQMNDVSSSSNVKRKPSTTKQRKISATSPSSGLGPGGDASSSDSLSTGSKKRA